MYRKAALEDLHKGAQVHYKRAGSDDFIVTEVEDGSIALEHGLNYVRLKDKHHARVSRCYIAEKDKEMEEEMEEEGAEEEEEMDKEMEEESREEETEEMEEEGEEQPLAPVAMEDDEQEKEEKDAHADKKLSKRRKQKVGKKREVNEKKPKSKKVHWKAKAPTNPVVKYHRESCYIGPKGGVWVLRGWTEVWERITPPVTDQKDQS